MKKLLLSILTVSLVLMCGCSDKKDDKKTDKNSSETTSVAKTIDINALKPRTTLSVEDEKAKLEGLPELGVTYYRFGNPNLGSIRFEENDKAFITEMGETEPKETSYFLNEKDKKVKLTHVDDNGYSAIILQHGKDVILAGNTYIKEGAVPTAVLGGTYTCTGEGENFPRYHIESMDFGMSPDGTVEIIMSNGDSGTGLAFVFDLTLYISTNDGNLYKAIKISEDGTTLTDNQYTYTETTGQNKSLTNVLVAQGAGIPTDGIYALNYRKDTGYLSVSSDGYLHLYSPDTGVLKFNFTVEDGKLIILDKAMQPVETLSIKQHGRSLESDVDGTSFHFLDDYLTD